MFNRNILTQIFAAFISLVLVIICNRNIAPVIKATTNSPGNILAAVPISKQDVVDQKLQQILDNQVAHRLMKVINDEDCR